MLVPTSQQAWETLEASFASQSTARVMHIWTELGKVKKHDYPNATAFFNKVKGLSDVLSSVGQPLRPDEFNTFLLAGLDSDYDALADRISARPVYDPLPVRDVYAQLLNTEQRVEARRAQLSVDNHHANYTARPSGGVLPPTTSAKTRLHQHRAVRIRHLRPRLHLPIKVGVVVKDNKDRGVVAALALRARYAKR
jgi:hypothetical protein